VKYILSNKINTKSYHNYQEVYFLTIILVLSRIISSYSGYLQNPIFTIIATIIIFNILRIGGVFGLAITFFDMTAWGNLFSTEQFGISGYFKFIDIEVIIIIIVSVLYYKKNSVLIDYKINKVFKAVIIIGIIYSLLSLTVFNSDLGGVLHIFRTFIYAILIYYIPSFVNSENDVFRIAKLILVFAILDSFFYLLQILFPHLPIYEYAQITQLETGSNQVRVYGMMLLLIVSIIPVLFAYLLLNKTKIKLKFVFLLILIASLSFSGRFLIVMTLISFLIIIYYCRNMFKNLTKALSIIFIGIFLLLTFRAIDLNIGNLILDRYETRSIDIMTDLDMGGGHFTMRALQFLAVPQFLGTTERLLFGAGFLYIPPQQYGAISPFIYAPDFGAISNYKAAGILTRNIGSAAHNENKIGIFFGDNGWAGIFAAMGILGLILYAIFIISLIMYTYKNLKISKNVLTKSIFLGLFCLLLFDPINFFLSAGYLDPTSMLHLVVFLSIAMRAKQLLETPKSHTAL